MFNFLKLKNTVDEKEIIEIKKKNCIYGDRCRNPQIPVSTAHRQI